MLRSLLGWELQINWLVPWICHFSLESCKSICFSIVNAPMEEVELRYSSQMWVAFWELNYLSKSLLFVLKLLNDSLPMRREFAKTSFINDASFPFCATIEESLYYLLITCELHSQFRIGLLFGWIECTRHKMCYHFTFIFGNTLWPIGSIETKCSMKQ